MVQLVDQVYEDPSWPMTVEVREGHLIITEKGDEEIKEPDIILTLRVGVDGKLTRADSISSES